MSSYADVEAVSTWLMAGGGIVAVFGVVAYMLSKGAGERGGLSHLLAIVGGLIFFLGVFIGSQWGSRW